MTTTVKMTKRAAHALAAELGLEVDPAATAEATVESIQAAVDEGKGLAAEEFLARALEAGFVPSAEVVEGEVVVEPGADGDTEQEALEDAENAAVDAAELTVGEVADEVGKALALREQAVTPTHALPTPAEYNVLGLLAHRTFNTTFVPVSYRGREADVFAAFLFGREIGLGPMMALRDVHMIEGRPSLAAHRQLAKLRQGGVVILESESTAERAWIKARRTDTGEVMAAEFTMEEASVIRDKKGMLVDKPNWRNYPADMLWARAVGRLTRRLGPDIAGGLPPYVAEEAADFSGWGVDFGEAGPTFREPAAATAPPDYRRDFPDYNWPQSLAEIRDRMGLILGVEEAAEWLRQAREALLPGADVSAPTKAEKDRLFQALSTVIAELDGPDGPTQFETGARAKVRAVFARRLEGAALEGPPWSLGPDEAETHPVKPAAEPAGEPEAEAEPEPSESAEDVVDPLEAGDPYYAQFESSDDIPFGSTDSSTP